MSEQPSTIDLHYDQYRDVLTIEGISYAGVMFRQLGGVLPENVPFKITQRTGHGQLWIERLDQSHHDILDKEKLRPDILTAGGTYFDFMHPEKSVIKIEDIAKALSHICRFNGHCKEFYSVAQHSFLASIIVPESDAMHALLHDAAEAYVGDVTRPLKKLIPDYKLIEKRVEKAIFERFNLSLELPQSVKDADMVMLASEARDLMPPHDDVWGCLVDVVPLPITIKAVSSIMAERLFLQRYYELSGESMSDD